MVSSSTVMIEEDILRDEKKALKIENKNHKETTKPIII